MSEPNEEKFLSLIRLSGELEIAELSHDMEKRYLKIAGGTAATQGNAVPLAASGLSGAGAAEKLAIAKKASELIKDGQSVAIGSGTTTATLADVLAASSRFSNLSVLTNALDIAHTLQDKDGVEVVVLGGVLRPGMHSLLGHLTELATQAMTADLLFMGISAISVEHGLMSDHTPEILTDRALRRMAARVVVLADSSKFSRSGPAYVFGLDDVATIVTDDGVDPDIVKRLEENHIEVLVAPRD